MQTRCPHCRTLFQIQEVQLQAAGGRARCSCCDHIFNARKHLISDEPGEPTEQSASGAISLESLVDENLSRDHSAAGIRFGFPETDDPDPANLFARETAGKPVDPPSPEASRTTKDDSSSPTQRPSYADLLTAHASDAIPDRDFNMAAESEIPKETGEAEQQMDPHLFTPDSRQRGRPFLWSIAILCLMAGALAQTVWLSRGNLNEYPEVRELLELVCRKTGCELPAWREPERFIISSRSVKTHPENSNALQIRLVFSNTARFAQPYPHLQLRLYDFNENLSAQRVFYPKEYLVVPESKTGLIEPAQSVVVEMALADPGIDITGFRIEFL